MAGAVGAQVSITGQVANISVLPLYTPIVSGRFRVSCRLGVTTVDGASSTLPKCTIGWTDPDSNQAETLDITAVNAGNVLTTETQAEAIIKAKAGVPITYLTTGYLSGTPATMAYNLDVGVEAL